MPIQLLAFNFALSEMDAAFCADKLKQMTEVVKSQTVFSLFMIVLDLFVVPITVIGNVLILRVLWKTLSIPDNMKRFFLSLAVSDLAVGVLIQPASAVIPAAPLSKRKNESNNLNIFYPHLLTAKMYALYFLVAASFSRLPPSRWTDYSLFPCI